MSLDRLEPCCSCPEHQRIFRNEDGWVLTQDFEAWTAAEWKRHCDAYDSSKRADRKARQAESARRRYHEKRDAA